jgi:hypothetical protein
VSLLLLYTAALQDTFQYRTTDSATPTALQSNLATVSVTVTDPPPTANPDQASVAAGATVTIPVLTNDLGGTEPLIVTDVTQPTQGNAAVTQAGDAVTFTAPANFAGQVSALILRPGR